MTLTHLTFILLLFLTLGIFARTTVKYIRLFRVTKPAFPLKNIPARIRVVLKVAFGQSKILQRPVIGFLHALVFWGFLVILVGSFEMLVDGLTGQERSFHELGDVYDFLTAATDVLAPVIAVAVIIFWIRRNVFHVRRYDGPEITRKSHRDANITLALIFLLMLTLSGMNLLYLAYGMRTGRMIYGSFPVSAAWMPAFLSGAAPEVMTEYYRILWWVHLLTIFFFANYLPYSKHFHVYLSIPNVFLSRPYPMGKLPDMPEVTKEVKAMAGGEEIPEEGMPDVLPGRFGILDVEDITWKNYLDSLTCTQCGRCTSVCPVHLAGGVLSPRKVMMNTRERMDEKAPGLLKGVGTDDGKSLLGVYITDDELWACTLCDACVRECPLNINQPELILGLRRYQVLEKASAPTEWNTVYTHVENNGALWKVSGADRMKWSEGLCLQTGNGQSRKIEVPVMGVLLSRGHTPEYLLWVGSAGAFDSRYKKVIRAFVKILEYLEIDYAVLGEEETSSGDFARRTGNEMLFLMQAFANIKKFHGYGIRKVITCDPHVYNTFKNEYPDFGEALQVIHHTQFLKQHLEQLTAKAGKTFFGEKKVTYHDPCYLGRINKEFEAPRQVIRAMGLKIREMPRNKANALCCGGGGGQMFRESGHGENEIFLQRTTEALDTGSEMIITACPYCMTMIGDGLKYKHREKEVINMDVAELVAGRLGI